ncbi:Outer membrane translocation and assembly module TamA [Pseudomonas syringae pv. actinidiae]|uniref:Outer membrane translocation and assembly module TamA n=1 Tax=Pseudomonas syringae pv. actinidiae TaxID=103796 RepID=A0A2V0Q5B6_PSESF|nr:Outer membrane translocation and assembly module TamA [Pseudomonas syringae pv. actinidiae]
MTSQRSTGRITLLFARLSDQPPQAGLKAGTPIGVRQTATGQLFSLGGIALSQTHLGQTIEHLGLARRNTLGTLKAGGRTVEVAAALLLLCRGQQGQYRAIKLFVFGQTATAGRDPGRCRRSRHAVAVIHRSRIDRRLIDRRCVDRRRIDAERGLTGRCREAFPCARTRRARHHHHHAIVLRYSLRLLLNRGGASISTVARRCCTLAIGHLGARIHDRNRATFHTGAAVQQGQCR